MLFGRQASNKRALASCEHWAELYSSVCTQVVVFLSRSNRPQFFATECDRPRPAVAMRRYSRVNEIVVD